MFQGFPFECFSVLHFAGRDVKFEAGDKNGRI